MTDQVWETPHGVRLRFPTPSKPYYRLDYTVAGRRRQPSVGKDREAAWAEAMRADALVAVDTGQLSELSAAEMFEAWFAEGSTWWKHNYRAGNRDTLDNHVLPVVSTIAVTDLRRAHIAQAVASGSTTRTQEVIRTLCSAALNWAEGQGWLNVSAASLLPPKPKRADASRKITDRLDPAQIPSVTDALDLATFMTLPRQPKKKKGRVAPQPEYRAYSVLVAAFCGLRLGEMLGLQGGDIDGDMLHVRRQAQYERGVGMVLTDPKWGSFRTVVIPDKAGDFPLGDWLRNRATEVGPDGYLFPAPHGGLWDVRNYREAVLDPARSVVWPGKKWSFHSLRHTYCTELLAAGVALNDVASMAGHSSPILTANTYIGRQAGSLDRVRNVINKE